MMNKHYLFSLLFLLLYCKAWAGDPDSSRLRGPGKELSLPVVMTEQRSFPQVEQLPGNSMMPVAAETLFTTDYLNMRFATDTTVNEYQQRAVAAFEELDRSNHYTTTLAPDDLNQLPIGLEQEVGNTKIKIAVSSAVFHPGYAELTVYAKIIIPQEPKQLFFGIKNLKLSYGGGIIGDARLVLLGNVPIPLNGGSSAIVLKGGFDTGTGQGLDMTYVTIDCAGFRELSLSADVMFPRSLLTPLDVDNERIKDENKLVTAAFQTTVRDWNDILVSIALPAFEITSLNGFGFHVGKAVFDGSDIRNSLDVVYPSGYAARYLPVGEENLWRGVYIRDLEVILPKQFSKGKNNGQRVSFGANNLIIDNNGITGSIFGRNILSAGSASGWRFSVDRFNLDLEANHLTGAGFDGTVQLPVASTALAYTAIITANDEYLLKINSLSQLSFNVWAAKAELDPNSWVQFKLADGKFQPEAMLTGRMGITTSGQNTDTASNRKSIVSFQGIRFTNLHLQTKAPYLTADYFGYNDEAKFSNFPVTITEIGLSASETQASLYFGVKVNLMSGSFGGETKVAVVGSFDNRGDYQTWNYEKLQLNLISIHARLGSAMTIDGALQILRDDPVYGDAIGGNIKMDVLNGKVKVDARALFGSTDFRYWYVDAKADLGLGIMVVPPISINGFGGGAYYHMKKAGVNTQASPTGVNYVPDENTGLGLKAMVLFNVGQKVANGEVTFEVAFNNSGGINCMGFFGYATILKLIPGVGDISDRLAGKFQQLADAEAKAMARLGTVGETLADLKVSDPAAAAKALSADQYRVGETGLSAYMGIQYDFTASTFHANFELYLNVAGGIIQGTASDKRAGWAVMHIAPGTWYMHMGTPANRIGIRFGVGSIAISTGAYLMVGDQIPGSPPPPQQVADILGVSMRELDYMRDLNSLGDGRGFAFGANISVETGDLTFLILYASFNCGVGFDIMLKDYGDAHCKGSNDPIGIDGWYANGQAYVYLQGEVGVKVNLRFIKGRFPIISGAAAVLLQAKLPNPVFMRGYMGVRFSILGGLVSGNMRMKVTIGSECEIETGSSAPVDVRIISNIVPAQNAMAVDVFAAPQAAFNMRMGQTFDVEDDNGITTYRVRLDTFTIVNNGTPVAGRLVWNDEMDKVSFYSKEILPPEKSLKAIVKVSFEIYRNGSWQTLYVDGKKSEEVEEITFTTGAAPDYIPMANVEYCYPVAGQKNFFPDEYGQGYISLKTGQTYLFDPRWSYKVQFVPGSGTALTTGMQYDSITQRIVYTMPAIQTSTDYSFNVIAIPPGGSMEGSKVLAYNQTSAGEDGSFDVKNNQAEIVHRGDVTRSLLEYNFHSSKYRTFAAKINGHPLKTGSMTIVMEDVIDLRAETRNDEPFDAAELEGNATTAYVPLVSTTAITDDAYFQADLAPKIYDNYPIKREIFITYRNTAELGIVPRKALYVMSSYLAQARAGKVDSWHTAQMPFVYNLPFYYKKDFSNIQYHVVAKYAGTPYAPEYNFLINGRFQFIRYGKYKVEYQYVLPGGIAGSRAAFEYLNPVK